MLGAALSHCAAVCTLCTALDWTIAQDQLPLHSSPVQHETREFYTMVCFVRLQAAARVSGPRLLRVLSGVRSPPPN